MDKTKIKNYRKKLGEYQFAKNNYKKPIKYNSEFSNIKIYFSTFKEGMNRFIIIIAQIIFAFGISFNGFLLTKMICDLIVNASDMRLAQTFLRLIFYFIGIIPILITLFFIIPILTSSKIRTLRLWCIAFLVWGNFIYFIALSISSINLILFFLHIANKNLPVYIIFVPTTLFLISSFLVFVSSISLISTTSHRLEKAEMAMFEVYEFNRVKIN